MADPSLSNDLESRQSFAVQSDLRSVVLDSWVRSKQREVDPNVTPGERPLSADELEELQRLHPIARVLPVVNRLLLDEAMQAGFVVAIGDAAGRLLWVDGDSRLRSEAEEMGFAAGADWSENAVGTSAPGSALLLGDSIQVLGAEHYNRAVHQWSCTAVPVHEPESGAIIGVIDVTGNDAAASPHILPLVEATRAAVEAELKLVAMRAALERGHEMTGQRSITSTARGSRRQPLKQATPRLMLLGRDPALLEHGGGFSSVSRRHAEILVALAEATGGLSAAALAEQVYGEPGAEQSLRPEVVRLRKWLAQHAVGLELLSRPYRLSGPLRLDAHETLEALERGAHRLALAAYEGPVLPPSDAPVIEQLRHEVDSTLREAMLQTAAAPLLFEYAQNWAVDDVQVWEALLQALPPLSPKRTRVVARLETLAAEG
ncbi:transcriptional regulator [Leucobacter albus]|uniref:Transcriptional regulator n=1 Tax=Leucobacter albus TaxID=272210 RepID=A0ABW3TML5_9MICO